MGGCFWRGFWIGRRDENANGLRFLRVRARLGRLCVGDREVEYHNEDVLSTIRTFQYGQKQECAGEFHLEPDDGNTPLGRLRRIVERGVNLIQLQRLYQHGYGPRVGNFLRRTGNKDDTGVRILCDDVAARGGAIQFRHMIVHQHDVRVVSSISVDRFQARSHHLDDFMLTKTNQIGQRCPDTSLIVRDQYAHASFSQKFGRLPSIFRKEKIPRSGRF